MPRSYQHISSYEKEILELKSQGLTLREIGAKFGFTEKQVHNFITRYNEKQRKIKAGVAIRAKGRPPKDYEVTEDMKINELKYIIARKDSKIKRLEMEAEFRNRHRDGSNCSMRCNCSDSRNILKNARFRKYRCPYKAGFLQP